LKDWKDIKNEIRNAEEPLSSDAWKEMEQALDGASGGKPKWLHGLWILLLLILVGGISWHYAPVEQAEVPMEDDSQSAVSEGRSDKSSGLSTSSIDKKVDQITRAQNQEEPLTGLKDGITRASNTSGELKKKVMRKASSPGSRSREHIPAKPRLAVTAVESDFEPVSINSKGVTLKMPTTLKWKSMQTGSDYASSGTENPGSSNIELKLYAAPTYNWTGLSYSTDASKKHRQLAEAAENAIQPGWGVDAGIELSYVLFKNIRLSTGLAYRKIQTENQYDFEINEIPVIDSASGDIISYIPLGSNSQKIQNSSSNTYTFLDVPVSMFYERPISEKWSITGEAIHRFSILLNQQTVLLNPTNLELSEPEEGVFNSMANSWQLKLGLRYQLKPNLYLAIEPGYRSYYQDIFNTKELSWKPSDLSLGMSVIMGIK